MLFRVARLALSPILYAQARRLRATALELPEPRGPRRGKIGTGPECLRLLVAGDSSAAGVGAPTQDRALVLPLARELARRLEGIVRWQLVAQTGLTSEALLRHLQHGQVQPADIAVVVIGVNDLTHEVPLQMVLRKRAEIVAWLRRHGRVRRILFTSMPEMQHFPLIPQPLAWYAGVHARRNNAAQTRWATTLPGVEHVDLSGTMRPELMARDGYHPAPELYAKVAARLAEVIAAGEATAEAAAADAAINMPAATDLDRALAGDESG